MSTQNMGFMEKREKVHVRICLLPGVMAVALHLNNFLRCVGILENIVSCSLCLYVGPHFTPNKLCLWGILSSCPFVHTYVSLLHFGCLVGGTGYLISTVY